jgi:endonuclease YncB( thermonuclease family)
MPFRFTAIPPKISVQPLTTARQRNILEIVAPLVGGQEEHYSNKKEIDMLKKYFFFFSGIMFLACPAFAGHMNAVCDKVVDANTLMVTANGNQYTVQLAYIVAPEPQQKFGAEAKQYLESLALKQNLRIDIIRSNDNVISAEVYSSKMQDPINRELVRKGLAWPILENNTKHPYDASVSLAKKRSLGVWSDPALKPPVQKSTSAYKKGSIATPQEESQGPSTGAKSSNFLMRQRQNISTKGNRGAQE